MIHICVHWFFWLLLIGSLFVQMWRASFFLLRAVWHCCQSIAAALFVFKKPCFLKTVFFLICLYLQAYIVIIERVPPNKMFWP